MAGRPIGELNGRWAFLLKLTVILVPAISGVSCAIAIPWVRWVTDRCYATDAHLSQMPELKADMDKMNAKIGTIPSSEWYDRIRALEVEMKQNNQDHAAIKIALERISSKLGVEGNK